MSKKNSVALFCETQCSDEEDDEDYIDRLIKKKGPDALNSLLKDQDYFESEADKEEIVELRDSLLPPASVTSSQISNSKDLVNHTNSDKEILFNNKNHQYSEQQLPPHLQPQLDDYKTPKNIMMGYHKRKQTGQQELSDSNYSGVNISWNILNHQKSNNFTHSSINLISQKHDSTNSFPQDQDFGQNMPNQLPDLEHQDTIVRQPSSTSNISLNSDAFLISINNAIHYFNNSTISPKPKPTQKEAPLQLKQQDSLQKQLINENEELKKQIGQLHNKLLTLQGQNKTQKKELQNQINIQQNQIQILMQNDKTKEIEKLEAKIERMRNKLDMSAKLLIQEKQEKEHLNIAYKRYISKLDSERSDHEKMNIILSGQSFLSSSSGNAPHISQRRSPSPHVNPLQTNSYLRSSGGNDYAPDMSSQLINDLRRELEKKDKEIHYYKNQHSTPQQILTSSVHLNSDENVLDDFEDDIDHPGGSSNTHHGYRYREEEQNIQYHQSNNITGPHQFYQITNNSAQNDFTPYKLSASTAATNLSNNFKKTYQNEQKQAVRRNQINNNQFYSYEKRSQSPLMNSNHTQISSHIPTNSSNFSQINFADRTHSPQQLSQAFKTQQNPGPGGAFKHRKISTNHHSTQQQHHQSKYNQLASSSYSSSSHSHHHNNQYISNSKPDGSFLKQHNNMMLAQGNIKNINALKSSHQSPQTLVQKQLKSGKQSQLVSQSLAFQVASSNKYPSNIISGDQSLRIARGSNDSSINGIVGNVRMVDPSTKNKFPKSRRIQQQQSAYMLTSSSGGGPPSKTMIGSSGMINHHPLMSAPAFNGDEPGASDFEDM
ncbi:UNKNOWN [Stylonychia lemnae]|uniref:Uncharacterized protein n=1 Tax=Stylonychia lemnae TaxID=5949 RepID=A0A078AB10_STYLE|nr:UNKNOWN [Stylonychia lemnae]|eukprot:CDW79460.1 UNKNOWN [Stylonychia lemnae]